MFTPEMLKLDLDAREAQIRERVFGDPSFGTGQTEDASAIIASYFLHTRFGTLLEGAKTIPYHMTSGVKHPPAGTLLEACTGWVVDVKPWDGTEKIGLVRVAFPLRMFERQDGQYYSTDILHIVGGAGQFAFWDFHEIKLVDVELPGAVIDSFPGPAYGCEGVRNLTGWGEDEPAFGTILKPTTGIVPQEVAELVGMAAEESLFMFVKEDENLFPALKFCPVVERARLALDAIKRAHDLRGGRGLIFAPHITCPPHLLPRILEDVLASGINGIMFSEYYVGGMARMVRELTRGMDQPPAIYGHNGGITCRTMSIYSEVLDLFARLDGIDFRQTGPLPIGRPLLRPQGLEWRNCETVLSKPLRSIRRVMIARAGGLDQSNILLNLADAKSSLPPGQVLYLAGSAINSLVDEHGKTDPRLGARAMRQALELWEAGSVPDSSLSNTAYYDALYDLAGARGYSALQRALEQRVGVKRSNSQMSHA